MKICLSKKILHTILNAVFWEEIMDAMLELFACIENDEKKTDFGRASGTESSFYY